jgi:hypothetical protein
VIPQRPTTLRLGHPLLPRPQFHVLAPEKGSPYYRLSYIVSSGLPMSADAYWRDAATCLGLANSSNDPAVGQKKKTSLAVRLARTWPAVVIGLGLVATIAWTAVLGWLVLHFAWLVL